MFVRLSFPQVTLFVLFVAFFECYNSSVITVWAQAASGLQNRHCKLPLPAMEGPPTPRSDGEGFGDDNPEFGACERFGFTYWNFSGGGVVFCGH